MSGFYFCDVCGKTIRHGVRYHCETCTDYDECSVCRPNSLHDKNHVVVEHTETEPVDAAKFRQSLGTEICQFFDIRDKVSHRRVEGAIGMDANVFAVFALLHGASKGLDDLAKIGNMLDTLQTLARDYPQGSHHGKCSFDDDGDSRLSPCQRCELEIMGWLIMTRVIFGFILLNHLNAIIAFGEKPDFNAVQVSSRELDVHWNTLDTKQQETYTLRATAMKEELAKMDWPLY